MTLKYAAFFDIIHINKAFTQNLQNHSSVVLKNQSKNTQSKNNYLNQVLKLLLNNIIIIKQPYLGLVSLSPTLLMNTSFTSSSCFTSCASFSLHAYNDEQAMAREKPSGLKASADTGAGYFWNWHSRFLFIPSHRFTQQSPPPNNQYNVLPWKQFLISLIVLFDE